MADKTETLQVQKDTSYTQNREVSWLRFNERVLEEAQDPAVPLYERLKFVSIFESNLDEFFMVRVGSLTDLSMTRQPPRDNKTGWTVKGQLREIFKMCEPLYRKRDMVFAEVEKALAQNGALRLTPERLDADDRKLYDKYFERLIRPVISPQILDMRHQFPHLANNALYSIVRLRNAQGRQEMGLIDMPAAAPSILFLKGEGTRYMLTEEVLRARAAEIFPAHKVEGVATIKVTRNADITPMHHKRSAQETDRQYMQRLIKQRARLAPVRLEICGELPASMVNKLRLQLKLTKAQVFFSRAPLRMGYVWKLSDRLRGREGMVYTPFVPQKPGSIDPARPMFEQILEKDIFLHYPYESIYPFLRLLREAAHDERVTHIAITVYRLARVSRLASHLMAAAENGKQVTVLMELRARFDEENNIAWAERLEASGCNVIYGHEKYKVHSKICLITRMTPEGEQAVTQIGTGNYNEKTAAQYTDFCLMSADAQICSDAKAFFSNMKGKKLHGQYDKLLVAPFGLKAAVLHEIDAQAARAKQGLPAGIFFKLNSLTDREILSALSEASCAGVKIRLLVRGICCLLPGIPERTENIEVHSIVGRYLEHGRIYCFGRGQDAKIYIASADLMTRNTNKRIEVACPVEDRDIHERLMNIMHLQWRDTVKGRLMLPDGQYVHLPEGTESVNSQKIFCEMACKAAEGEKAQQDSMDTGWQRMLRWLRGE